MGCEMDLKVSLPLITIGAANAFGWLFAYLRGAIVIADWITGIAGHDSHLIMLLMVALFTVIGDFHRADTNYHNLHAIGECAD
jgi:C4-dicarboxylate transporter, DctM subunit